MEEEDIARGNFLKGGETSSLETVQTSRPLELARNQRAKLMNDLENWWSILEEGVPDLETERETHTFQRGRRERD